VDSVGFLPWNVVKEYLVTKAEPSKALTNFLEDLKGE
jgi:hypothetical protein